MSNEKSPWEIERDLVAFMQDNLQDYENHRMEELNSNLKTAYKNSLKTKKDECLSNITKMAKYLLVEREIAEPNAFKKTDTEIKKIEGKIPENIPQE